MTRLVLIRHGVTKWNIERRYCGRKDVSLSKEGRAQIKLLADRLNSVRFDKVYCSDKKRAMQSARMLFKEARIITDPGLNEIDFGVLEGLRREEIIQRHAKVYKRWLKNYFKTNIPEAEPMNVFKKRVENALEKIAVSNSGKTAAVVCHGGVIGIFVKTILKRRSFWSCIPSPASITMIEYKNGKFGLKKFNDTSPLNVKR